MTTQDLIALYRGRVEDYLKRQCWDDVPVMAGRRFAVSPLAGGEYNLNYLLGSDQGQLVFRVNIGTQIGRDDQIVYEYQALRLLRHSRATPVPFFVDDSRTMIDRGISIMEYLPGCPLDYRLDLAEAAATFAVIHQTEVQAEENHLIVEDRPLSLIYSECMALLDAYIRSDLANPGIRSFLKEVADWADKAREKERYFQEDPWHCIVNTEVNSGNFIVNRKRRTCHLIDWEMPRWGDPSTDLCHFCSPLTTLWKTDYRFAPESQEFFLDRYKQQIRSRHLRDTLGDRMQLKMPFVYLRGISWSAMGWVAYQTEYRGIRNEDTWAKLNRYLDPDCIRALFLPFMKMKR